MMPDVKGYDVCQKIKSSRETSDTNIIVLSAYLDEEKFQQMKEYGNLKQALEKKQFAVTTEVQAPIEQEPEDLVKSLNLIRGRVDGVLLSEMEFQGVAGDTIKICQTLKANRFESIYQTTTGDKNHIQLQKDLISAHYAGIENLLAFTEDYRITGSPDHRRQPPGNDVFPRGCRKASVRARILQRRPKC